VAASLPESCRYVLETLGDVYKYGSEQEFDERPIWRGFQSLGYPVRSEVVTARYCQGWDRPTSWGNRRLPKGKGRLFPVLGGGPVSTETPSFYEGKSLFLPLGRASLSSDSDSLTFARPHCGGWSAPVPAKDKSWQGN
jgi:hypothetical protein